LRTTDKKNGSTGCFGKIINHMGVLQLRRRLIISFAYCFQNKSYKATKQNKVFSEQKVQSNKAKQSFFCFLCNFVAFVLKKLCFALFFKV
jgi:hypothetical protein